MKSPQELAVRLAAQWRRTDLRLRRLTTPSAWPVRLPIGRPQPADLDLALDAVRAHVHAWTDVATGIISWEDVAYRGASATVRVPVYWILSRPSEWIDACGDPDIRRHYEALSRLCKVTPAKFHRVWIGKQYLWLDRGEAPALAASRLAEELEPECAHGLPLRALARGEVDTKFYEQNRALLIALLDARFDNAATERGLEDFLGAARDDDHWVLLVDLDGTALPFARQRVRTSELANLTHTPGSHLLVVENERTLHQIPRLPATLAVLGCGRDLAWLEGPAWREKHVAYWGDLDTWGLHLLSHARHHCPRLSALLMDRATFDAQAPGRAVVESVTALAAASTTLADDERALFEYLGSLGRGRLEQEFLPEPTVRSALTAWHRRGS